MKEQYESFAEAFLDASTPVDDKETDTATLDDGQEQPTPGENQPDETETPETSDTEKPVATIKIGDKDVQFFEGEDGVPEYVKPDNYDEMTAEEKKVFDRKAEEAATTLPELKKQRMTRRDKEIQSLKEEIQNLTNLIKTTTAQPKPEAQDSNEDDPTKYFGVETWDDVSLLQQTDPERYHRGIYNMSKDASGRDSEARAKQRQIESEIVRGGHDPAQVAAFAKQNDISNLAVAYDYYKIKNDTGKPPLVRIREQAPSAITNRGAETSRPKKSLNDTVNDILTGDAK